MKSGEGMVSVRARCPDFKNVRQIRNIIFRGGGDLRGIGEDVGI